MKFQFEILSDPRTQAFCSIHSEGIHTLQGISSEILEHKKSLHPQARALPRPYRTETKWGHAFPQKHSYGFAQEPRHKISWNPKGLFYKTNCWAVAIPSAGGLKPESCSELERNFLWVGLVSGQNQAGRQSWQWNAGKDTSIRLFAHSVTCSLTHSSNTKWVFFFCNLQGDSLRHGDFKSDMNDSKCLEKHEKNVWS